MKLMQLEGKLSITGEKINFIPPKNRIINKLGREKGFPCQIHRDTYHDHICHCWLIKSTTKSLVGTDFRV